MDKREEIVSENLKLLLATCNGLDARLSLQAYEMINLYHGEIDRDTAYEIIAQEAERVSSLPLSFSSSWLWALSSVLYKKIAAEIKREHFLSLFGEPEDANTLSAGKVAYTKNKFTLMAFDRFVSVLPDAKTLYTDSFSDACQAVYNGLAEFCILPVENTKDGSLPVFYSLIAKYDLRIVASTDILGVDESGSTLALLAKSTAHRALPESLRVYRFDLSVEGADAALILAVASSFGLSPLRIDSLTQRGAFHLRFSMEKASSDEFSAFLLYLSAAFPSFSPLGLYRHID